MYKIEDASGSDSESGSQTTKRKRQRNGEDDNYTPDELAFSKADYFRVEKWLLTYGYVCLCGC
jgi:hypothetical protein